MQSDGWIASQATLIFPLLAAILYAVGAVLLKRAGRLGIGVVRTTVAANVVTALLFLPFFPWSILPIAPDPWWPILLTGFLFLAGQIFTVLAFTIGQVSVATPVLGAKVFLVALIAAGVAGAPVERDTWVAALFATLGILLIVGLPTRDNLKRGGAGAGFACALLAALGFAAFDVCVQVWSPRLGFGLLVPPAIVVGAVLTLPLLLLKSRGGRQPISLSALQWLVPGIFFLAGQSVILIWAIGTFGDAAGANVVYATRGLWSVAVVYLLARWTLDQETMNEPGVGLRRLAGAFLMVLAVWINA